MDEKLSISTVSKILEHRKYVMKEFIDSEREYVRRLQIAWEDYYCHIKSGTSESVPPDLKNDLLSIFSTLPDIYKFHKHVFLPSLESCNWDEDANAIMDCFLKHNLQFHPYLAFCKNKPVSDGVRVEYEKYFSSRQLELGQKLNIEDLLIAPVQRLPKYQLLIRDLLKDTRKANLDTVKIEEALELMMKIPQETNNIICMSLLRGISRARILSHGSLWRQSTLIFSCTLSSWTNNEYLSSVVANCNAKNEPRQVFLFDHRILIATTADADGFFEYQMDVRTLNGQVAEESENPCLFSFTTENNITCYFKAKSFSLRKEWVKDIRSILDSQQQMKKALLFGKSDTQHVRAVRMHSLEITTEWSDSDSSVDSMPSSNDEEDDWPEDSGFQNVNKPHISKPSPSLLSVPEFSSLQLQAPIKGKYKKKRNRSSSSPSKEKPPHTAIMDHLMLGRPHSIHADSVAQFDQGMLRKSQALAISPRMLRSWVARKYMQSNEAFIYFPTHSIPSFNGLSRSPGSKPSSPSLSRETLFIAREDLPAIAEQVYRPQPCQVFQAEDCSNGDVWKMKALSGDNAGTSVWVQRNCLEEYSAPISLRPLKKNYQILNRMSVGRFSELKLARSNSTKTLHALKFFHKGVTEDHFYRELCIGTRMRHKNLLSYYSGIQKPIMIIAMDYINGRQLLDYLVHKSSVTEKMIVTLIKQLLEGLQYMHSHTIFHLDIRPENVMIDLKRDEDVLKIIDYGAARHSGDIDDLLSHDFETCYNYEYVPPEIFKQTSLGPGTDLWGVAIIMYIIFFGCTPFYGSSQLRMVANITSVRYSFPNPEQPPPCSQHALQIIKDTLVLSPSQRPSIKEIKESNWFTEDLSSNKLRIQQLRRFIIQHS